MLIDDVEITISAGHGGAGKVSFGPMLRSGPDGGDGGRGGDVYIQAISDLRALNQFSAVNRISAPDGSPGGKNLQSGKSGDDIEIRLPVGTTLTDLDTGEQFDIVSSDQNFLICRGGLGGRGNASFKSPRNPSPTRAQPGLPGQIRHLHLVLRFLADYGLIGLPNAGKSSLLNELTKARARIGAYPFTTLEANLGTLPNSKVIADIPGLIEGASEGKGLGIKFLKHIEKVQKLLHCISADSPDVLADFTMVNAELEKYDYRLVSIPRHILLTKIDLVDQQTLTHQVQDLSSLGYRVVPVSIHDWDSMAHLRSVL